MALDQTGVYQYNALDMVNSWAALLNMGMSSVSNVLKDVYGRTVVVGNNYSDALGKIARVKGRGATVDSTNNMLVYLKDRDWFGIYNGSTIIMVDKPTIEANQLLINGQHYQASGAWRVSLTKYDYSNHPAYSATIQLTWPFQPPAGWTFEVYTLASMGFTYCQTGHVDSGKRVINIRVTQLHVNMPSAIQKIGWRLVRDA